MFILQTPGNVIIILLQILYHQNWTTWITYLITFVEQGTIVVILLVLKYKNRSSVDNMVDVNYDTDSDYEDII